MVTRTSTRWHRHWPSVRKYRSVPFITQCGKFSTHELITWNCTAEQLIASTTSTIYTRLLKIWLKRKRRFRDIKRDDRALLLKVAALYATSHSDYFLDRALAVLHRPGPLAKVVNCFVRKLDDKFWFVYSQVCIQTNWLTFQSLGISDKSSKLFLRRFMPNDTKRFRDSIICSAFETAADDCRRVRFRARPYVSGSKLCDKGASVQKDPTVLAFLEYESEPEIDSDW